MSKKGGYQIVDLGGRNFVTTTGEAVAQTIPGIYSVIEGNYHKPVLLSGIVCDNTEYSDAYTNLQLSGTTYIATIYFDLLGGPIASYRVTITDADSVTIEKQITT